MKKEFFGAILTVLMICGLIYAAVVFVNTAGGNRDLRAMIIYGVIGLIFFIAGIGLVRTTEDESK